MSVLINQIDPSFPYVICVDFDGTLVSDNFPGVGEPYIEMFELIRVYKQHGTKFILWTCRCGERLTEAVELCRLLGLEFDAINDNLPEVVEIWGVNGRKVYAEQYWDDKAVRVCNGSKLD